MSSTQFSSKAHSNSSWDVLDTDDEEAVALRVDTAATAEGQPRPFLHQQKDLLLASKDHRVGAAAPPSPTWLVVEHNEAGDADTVEEERVMTTNPLQQQQQAVATVPSTILQGAHDNLAQQQQPSPPPTATTTMDVLPLPLPSLPMTTAPFFGLGGGGGGGGGLPYISSVDSLFNAGTFTHYSPTRDGAGHSFRPALTLTPNSNGSARSQPQQQQQSPPQLQLDDPPHYPPPDHLEQQPVPLPPPEGATTNIAQPQEEEEEEGGSPSSPFAAAAVASSSAVWHEKFHMPSSTQFQEAPLPSEEEERGDETTKSEGLPRQTEELVKQTTQQQSHVPRAPFIAMTTNKKIKLPISKEEVGFTTTSSSSSSFGNWETHPDQAMLHCTAAVVALTAAQVMTRSWGLAPFTVPWVSLLCVCSIASMRPEWAEEVPKVLGKAYLRCPLLWCSTAAVSSPSCTSSSAAAADCSSASAAEVQTKLPRRFFLLSATELTSARKTVMAMEVAVAACLLFPVGYWAAVLQTDAAAVAVSAVALWCGPGVTMVQRWMGSKTV